MSFETDLKETFMRHADDVRPDIESWPAVEKKVRRNHYARTVTASVATVALIAAASILLPRLGRTTKPHGFVGPNSTGTQVPSQTYTIKPVAGKTTYLNPQQGWLIQYPTAAWSVNTSDPGRTIFAPDSGPAGGEFVESIRLEIGDYRTPLASSSGSLTVEQRSVYIAGLPALEVTAKVGNGQLNDVSYQLDWSGRCAPASTTIITGNLASTATCPPPDAPAMLVIDLNGTTAAMWNSFRSTAQTIANSLRPVAATSGATGPLRTINGSAPAFVLNGFSRTVLQFMEARVTGSGAEAFMCCTAPQSFGSFGGLYDNGGRIIKYELQYDSSVAGTGNERRIGAFVTYVGGRTQTELLSVDVQSGGSTKVADMCTACGGA